MMKWLKTISKKFKEVLRKSQGYSWTCERHNEHITIKDRGNVVYSGSMGDMPPNIREIWDKAMQESDELWVSAENLFEQASKWRQR